MNAEATATCRLHKPGRCYIPKEQMAFRIGQIIRHRGVGFEDMKGEVVREWIRTATGEHVVYCRFDCGPGRNRRYLFHSLRANEVVVCS